MELTEVGYFSRTHGIKGQLVLKAEKDFYFEEVKIIFTESSGSKAPHFIEEIAEGAKALVVKLEEINSVEKAKALVGKKVFVNANLVEQEGSDAELIGYEVIDKKKGSLGFIKSVNSEGPQLLVTIDHKNKEIILPLAEELIIKIDNKKKQIKYNTPDGLIDIYLE